jgi:hypothetical protein
LDAGGSATEASKRLAGTQLFHFRRAPAALAADRAIRNDEALAAWGAAQGLKGWATEARRRAPPALARGLDQLVWAS